MPAPPPHVGWEVFAHVFADTVTHGLEGGDLCPALTSSIETGFLTGPGASLTDSNHPASSLSPCSPALGLPKHSHTHPCSIRDSNSGPLCACTASIRTHRAIA